MDDEDTRIEFEIPRWVWWRGMLLTLSGLERIAQLTPMQRNKVAEIGHFKEE